MHDRPQAGRGSAWCTRDWLSFHATGLRCCSAGASDSRVDAAHWPLAVSRSPSPRATTPKKSTGGRKALAIEVYTSGNAAERSTAQSLRTSIMSSYQFEQLKASYRFVESLVRSDVSRRAAHGGAWSRDLFELCCALRTKPTRHTANLASDVGVRQAMNECACTHIHDLSNTRKVASGRSLRIGYGTRFTPNWNRPLIGSIFAKLPRCSRAMAALLVGYDRDRGSTSPPTALAPDLSHHTCVRATWECSKGELYCPHLAPCRTSSTLAPIHPHTRQ